MEYKIINESEFIFDVLKYYDLYSHKITPDELSMLAWKNYKVYLAITEKSTINYLLKNNIITE